MSVLGYVVFQTTLGLRRPVGPVCPTQEEAYALMDDMQAGDLSGAYEVRVMRRVA